MIVMIRLPILHYIDPFKFDCSWHDDCFLRVNMHAWITRFSAHNWHGLHSEHWTSLCVLQSWQVYGVHWHLFTKGIYIRQCDSCVVELLKGRGGGGCLVNKMHWDTVNFTSAKYLIRSFWGVLSFTGWKINWYLEKCKNC